MAGGGGGCLTTGVMLGEHSSCQCMRPTGDKACAAQNFELLFWGRFYFRILLLCLPTAPLYLVVSPS